MAGKGHVSFGKAIKQRSRRTLKALRHSEGWVSESARCGGGGGDGILGPAWPASLFEEEARKAPPLPAPTVPPHAIRPPPGAVGAGTGSGRVNLEQLLKVAAQNEDLDPRRRTRFLPPPQHRVRESGGGEEGSSLAATASSSEYALLSERVADGHGLVFHQQMQPALPPVNAARALPEQSRIGRVRGAVREIVEVQGGHIVRSTGRKDRHSKVCTAKGPRDRRVRLSAHTAIQFYDVQDRLGYDRPSKAVDWLIKNAKASIDQLAELPAWTPTATASTSRAPPPSSRTPADEQPAGESGKRPIGVPKPAVATAFDFGGSGNSGFLPPSLDSDAIADTIKSFFPIAATSQSSSPPIGFHAYPPEMLARSSSQSQDLRLSLQSFQDSIFHNSSHHHHHNHSSTPSTHNSLLAGAAHLGFDAMPPWNVAETSGVSGGGFDGTFSFNVPPPQVVPLHSSVLCSPPQFFSQRGPLQSSNPPSVRGWAAELIPMHPALHSLHSPIPPTGFAPETIFPGFRIPARIQGEEDHHQHGGDSTKPTSASSGSCH